MKLEKTLVEARSGSDVRIRYEHGLQGEMETGYQHRVDDRVRAVKVEPTP